MNFQVSACQNNILFHFHYSTCVEETTIPCNGTSVCDNKEDLRLCKDETLWKNAVPLRESGNVYCNGSGQVIKSQKHNDGVFDCVNRRDEVPFKKTQSVNGELVKKTMYS